MLPQQRPTCSRTHKSGSLIGGRIRGSKLSAPPSLGGPRFRSMQAVVLPCQGEKTRLRVDKHHHFAISTALPRHTHLKFPHSRPHLPVAGAFICLQNPAPHLGYRTTRRSHPSPLHSLALKVHSDGSILPAGCTNLQSHVSFPCLAAVSVARGLTCLPLPSRQSLLLRLRIARPPRIRFTTPATRQHRRLLRRRSNPRLPSQAGPRPSHTPTDPRINRPPVLLSHRARHQKAEPARARLVDHHLTRPHTATPHNTTQHGRFNVDLEPLWQAVWVQGSPHPHAGARRRRQDHHPVQAQAQPDHDHHPDRRLQRRDLHLQEHQVQHVGRRWPGQDSPAVEALLQRYARSLRTYPG